MVKAADKLLTYLVLTKAHLSLLSHEREAFKVASDTELDETPDETAQNKRIHAINSAKPANSGRKRSASKSGRGGGGGGGGGRGGRGGGASSGNESAGQNTAANSSKKATH